MSGPLSCTAGGAISIQASGGVANSNTKIKDCTFVNGFYHLYMPAAHSGNWPATPTQTMSRRASTPATRSIKTRGLHIHDCGFFANGASAKAIVQVGAEGSRSCRTR